MLRRLLNFSAFLSMGWTSLTYAHQLAAQAIELGGGDSSLYQSGGGSVTLHTQSYDLTFSAGTANGNLLEGVRVVKPTPRGTYILGDDRIEFQLPTDIFDEGHFLQVRGLGFRGRLAGNDVIAFAGAIAQGYSSPFFSAAKVDDPAGVLFVNRKAGRNWQFFSDTVVYGMLTQIAALKWTPSARMEVGLAGGVGANQPFAAVSLKMLRPKYDILAGYVDAGSQFHRVVLSSPLLSEPDKGNVQVTVRPSEFLTLAGGFQNFLVPQPSGALNASSTIEQGTTTLKVLGTQLSGTFFRSSYRQPLLPEAFNHAVAASLAHDFSRRFHLRANYLVGKPKHSTATASLIGNLAEDLNAHLSVNESILYSGGHLTANFGGQIYSNILTLSATYETFYVPAQNQSPFEEALLLDLKLRLFGRLVMHGATFVDPTGHLRYSADAYTALARTPAHKPKANDDAQLGRYLLHGCVVDARGVPIEGAAVLVDRDRMYTDSSGCFSMRESKPRTHQLTIEFSGFLTGGDWQISSMPATIASTTEDRILEATAIVTLRRSSGNEPVPSAATQSTSGNRFP